jgi:putative ABC transport system permease protein
VSFLAAIRVAMSALLVNKGRSMLTSLGIVIGISAVIAMVSAGGGARETLDERLDNVGKNLILVRAGARTQHGAIADFKALTREDGAALRKHLGLRALGVADTQITQRLAATATAHWPTVIVGMTPDLQPVRRWTIVYGRFISEEDVKKDSNVCLVGRTAQQKLFPNTPNPVGQMLRVDRLQFRVVGVLGAKGRSPTGADQDDQIFVPITTLQHRLVGEEKVALIVVAARKTEDIDQVKAEITQVMRDRHHLKPGVVADFDVSTVQEMAELAVLLTRTMQILIGVIASVSLVVGGIGIMNIMLVSVTERTREIGIRMAIGATGFDVLVQFLIEAVILSLAGGLIGITLGVVAAVGLAHIASWPVIVEPGIVVLAFVVSAGVGVFFGYYPALKASRLDPIEALRYE